MPPSPSIDTTRYGPSRSTSGVLRAAVTSSTARLDDADEIVAAGALRRVGREHAAHQRRQVGVGRRVVDVGAARVVRHGQRGFEQLLCRGPTFRSHRVGASTEARRYASLGAPLVVSSWRSHALAMRSSRSTVAAETPTASAVSS